MKFDAIVLTTTGDYLIEDEEQLEETEKGVRLRDPRVINEDEKAQKIQARRMFVPYSSVENVQYGEFEHDAV